MHGNGCRYLRPLRWFRDLVKMSGLKLSGKKLIKHNGYQEIALCLEPFVNMQRKLDPGKCIDEADLCWENWEEEEGNPTFKEVDVQMMSRLEKKEADFDTTEKDIKIAKQRYE